jgi:hypothetical protein
MAYWSCVQLEPCRERLALHCLSKVNGFEVYSPRIRPSRARREDDTRPLFPGYAFVIVLQWHAARWSPAARFERAGRRADRSACAAGAAGTEVTRCHRTDQPLWY